MGITTSDGKYFEDEFDYVSSIQQPFKGKVTDPIQVPNSFENLSTGLKRAPGGIVDKNIGDILSMQVDDIPEGMSARDFYKQLQQQTASQYQKLHGPTDGILAQSIATSGPDSKYDFNDKASLAGKLNPNATSNSIEDRRGMLYQFNNLVEDLTGRTFFPEHYGNAEIRKKYLDTVREVSERKTDSLTRDAGVLDVGMDVGFAKEIAKVKKTKSFSEVKEMDEDEFDKWFKDGGIIKNLK